MLNTFEIYIGVSPAYYLSSFSIFFFSPAFIFLILFSSFHFSCKSTAAREGAEAAGSRPVLVTPKMGFFGAFPSAQTVGK